MNEFSIYAASLGSGTDPVVVSWWAGAGYKKHIDRLVQSFYAEKTSCAPCMVDHLVLRSDYDPRGWEHNCARKPQAIKFAFDLLHRPIVWLDADAEVLGPIDFREIIPEGQDLSVMRPRGRWPLVNSSLMSGTIGFGYNPTARALIHEWEGNCAAIPAVYDQETLAYLLEAPTFKDRLKITDLDPRFICVPDLMPDVTDPVVIHHQASREAECRYQA